MVLHRSVVPPRCSACGKSCRPPALICTRCAERLSHADPLLCNGPAGLDRAWSSAPHEAVARDLVAALRHRRLVPVASLMADRIEWLAPSHMLGGTLVPVPSAPRRGLGRSVEPAEEIAACLSERLDAPLQPCLERREVRHPSRLRLPRSGSAERSVVRATAPVPRNVVLVDDVLDTGATLSECARALRAVGAGRVVAVTFARRL